MSKFKDFLRSKGIAEDEIEYINLVKETFHSKEVIVTDGQLFSERLCGRGLDDIDWSSLSDKVSSGSNS